MEKIIYDESNGLWYELQGDYYLPWLKPPEEEPVHIGIWGQRHLRYLKENRRMLFSNLQLSGKLNSYLSDIDRQAQDMFEQLIKQIAEREGVNEQLKVDNQIEWVRSMNNIKNRISQTIYNDLICR